MNKHPHPSPPSNVIVRAGGALVWRRRSGVTTSGLPKSPDDIEVMMVHRPRYEDWSWPKGKIEPGEHLVSCAVREVEEETGYVVRLGVPLTTQRYRLGGGATKEVYYWVGTLEDGLAPGRARFPVAQALEKEIDEVRWVRPIKARRMLTRRGDRRLLDELMALFKAGTLDTRPVILLRHAKAQSRSNWRGKDNVRPLERLGVFQSLGLVRLFSAYGVSMIVTSPWRRCVATVSSYASLSGANVELAPELSEDAFAADPRRGRQVFAQVLHQGTEPSVVCVHRPCLPALIGEIALAAPNSLTRDLPQDDPYLNTGAMLVAHVSAGKRGKVVAVEQHRANIN